MDLIHLNLLVLIALTNLFIGYRVWISDKRDVKKLMFFLTAVNITLWLAADFSLYQMKLANMQTMLNRADLVFAVLMIASIIHFTTIFPRQIRSYSTIFYKIAYAVALVLLPIILFTNKVVDFAFMEAYGSNFKQGSLFLLFAGLIITLCVYLIVALTFKYIKLKGQEKKQFQYILVGIAITVLFNVVLNLIVPIFTQNFRYSRFGASSTLFFVLFSAYSILKYDLFNIKIITTEAAIIAVNIIMAIQVFSSRNTIEGVLKGVFCLVLVYGSKVLLDSVKKEIEQRKKIEVLAKQLGVANEHLKEMDKLKDDFLSMASHELNTPITAIKGYLSMILEEHLAGEVNPTAKQYLNRVYESAKRLSELVKDLLNVSRIESGRIHLIYEEAQIEDLIEQAQAEVMPYVKNAGHKMTFEEQKKKMPKTWLDKTRITEILINIMGNAVKYTDPPGLIEISAKADHDFITVSIKDNGRGIPKDKQNTVFAKFSQIDVLKDQVKGTGLGMYISKKFIELMRGKIWFDSNEGKGTTFFFTVPVLAQKPVDAHEGEGAILH